MQIQERTQIQESGAYFATARSNHPMDPLRILQCELLTGAPLPVWTSRTSRLWPCRVGRHDACDLTSKSRFESGDHATGPLPDVRRSLGRDGSLESTSTSRRLLTQTIHRPSGAHSQEASAPIDLIV